MNSKKEEVIKAAKELFSQYGYKKVSMDEIARKSKVTKKTIYTYFKDKNDLFKYLLMQEIEEMKKQADKISQKDIPFEDKLHELIIVHMDYRSNSKFLKTLLEEEKKQRLSIADECEEILNVTIKEEIKKRLEEAINDGYIKDCDTEITAFFIYKIYSALMFELDKPLDKQKATESIINILKIWLIK